MSYILTGLFHPARKVREVYWRIYNTCYLGAQDAMTPYYPNLGELSDEKNNYSRDVLAMVRETPALSAKASS
jgi:splicing factor 3B subunit 1